MSVNLRTKYLGNSNLAKRNRPSKKQFDYYLNGKRKRETIKDTRSALSNEVNKDINYKKTYQ